MAAKRFGYYARLSTADKRIYRKSDAVGSIEVPHPGRLRPVVQAMETALAAGKRVGVGKSAQALANALCSQLQVAPVRVRVREVRPQIEGGELHGLYTFALEKDDVPEIEVWMRTAAHRQVVRFKTFLRTLVHELLHHLDVVLLGLTESFHTEGFFRRESALVRMLLATDAAPASDEAERASGGRRATPGGTRHAPPSDGDGAPRKAAAGQGPRATPGKASGAKPPRNRKPQAAGRPTQLRLFD